MENNEKEFQNGSASENGYTQQPDSSASVENNGAVQSDPFAPYDNNGAAQFDPFAYAQNNGNAQAPNHFGTEGNGYTQVPNNQQMGYVPPMQEEGSKGMAIAGMVCGIVSLVCCCSGYIALVLGIVGFILSLLVIIQKKPGKGMAIAGIVCSVITIILIVVLMAIGNSISPEDAQRMIEEIQKNAQ